MIDDHHMMIICRLEAISSKMWKPTLILFWICVGVKSEIANSLRELAGGAFLKATPFGDKNLRGKAADRTFQYVSKLDAEDCGKKLLCGLAGKQTKLAWDEEIMLDAFQGSIDYTSPYVQLRVAVEVGRKNVTNCKMVYSRCSLKLKEMIKLLRRQGISFEIPGEEKDCSVYFLWKTSERAPRKQSGERVAKRLPQISGETDLSSTNVPQIPAEPEVETEMETENTTIKPEDTA